MRIIAGIHKSRKLETLEGLNTRPMMDRMKESVFNTIGPYFDDLIVLDLFGGSGALSLEAISRGCKMAYIVEANKNAVKVIKNNISLLKEENRTRVINSDYQIALNKFKNDDLKFDIIFLDPPYRLNIVDEILTFLEEHKLINNDGIIVCQYVKGNHEPKETETLRIIKNYNYGKSEICIYQKTLD